jgi:hypothetical protein
MLDNYNQFEGFALASGYLQNALAYQGVTAPHTGKPYSDALLMGINGGIAAGYFAFEYEGHDPHLHFLTRYPFNENNMPIAAYDRLAIPIEPRATTDPQKAVANVVDALVAGKPAIVWLDIMALYYGAAQHGIWLINPVLVYGYDPKQNLVYVADRARAPLIVSAERFAAARNCLSKTRNRMMTVGAPDHERLPLAVEAGIRACIDIFTGRPPVGAASSWGFAAYEKWASLLISTKGKQSWAKMFATGPRLYSGLISTYKYVQNWYTGGCGARHIYADFLVEAADILGRPGLREVSGYFRQSASLWQEFMRSVLPDDVAPFREARDLMDREYEHYLSRGLDAFDDNQQIQARLKDLRQTMETGFPLTDTESTAMRGGLADHIMGIHDIETTAFDALKAAL